MVRKSPYIVALIASICIFDQAHGTGEKDIDLTKSSLAASPTQERTMIFVSDLHLGVGRDPEYPKRWHNLEDFRWHKEFEDFLRKIDEDGKSKVDLVLVGDTLELWQSLNEKDCDHDKIDENLGCNEEEAKRLVKRVVEQHKKVFDTLSDFVKKGENRIAIIPGNHDAALQFEGVRKIVMDAFSDYARQWVRVATEGYWISADGRVYAEHGHQIGADPNKLEGWPTAPFIYHNGTRYLRQPWGEQFVQKYYNWYEKVFPVIDNLSEETQGISYAIKARGFMGTMDAVAKYVRFTLTQTSWKQTGQGLGRNGIPEWKLADIQRTLKTPETRRMFLIESMAKDDPVRLAIEEQLKNGQAFPNIPEFSTDEIQTLCNRRWAISKTPDIGVVPCKSTGGLGTLAEAIKTLIYPAAKDQRFREYLRTISESLPESVAPKRKFSIFVYAHTHKVENDYRPFAHGAPWTPTVFNDGAWQRTATPEQFLAIAQKKGLDESKALTIIQPEDLLPACYPFVSVSSKGNGMPKACLRYWVHNGTSPGCFKVSCPSLDPAKRICDDKWATELSAICSD